MQKTVTVTCETCKQTFDSTTTNEEAYMEMYQIMPEAIHDPYVTLCDDCYQEFRTWFDKLTPQKREEMRLKQIQEIYN